MKILLNNEKYDTRMIASDWRFSASIVGLCKYFDFFNITYNKPTNKDYIEYNQKDLNEEKYLEFFVKNFYNDYPHKLLMDILKHIDKDTFDENENIIIAKFKELKDLKKPKKILNDANIKKINKDNYEYVLSVLKENDYELSLDRTLTSKKSYQKYCNQTKAFLLENNKDKVCRLNGFYVDMGKKSKSLGYCFNKSTIINQDIKEFDFIPFAFTNSYISIFINNNITIDSLLKTYDLLTYISKSKGDNSNINSTKTFLNILSSISPYNMFNIEIIFKDLNKNYFETLILTQETLNIINNYRYNDFLPSFSFLLYDNTDVYVNFFDLFNRIVNYRKLDDWITILLKRNTNDFQAKMLIELNYLIYNIYKEDNNMSKKQKIAMAVGSEVYNVLSKKNDKKIDSYKHRLLNAMATNNKELVLQILTYIHESTNVKISFIFDLIEDYENNKNLVYTFIMSMNPKYEKNNEENK